MHIKVHYSHINLTVVELILPTGALVSECTNTETLKFNSCGPLASCTPEENGLHRWEQLNYADRCAL